MVAILFTGRQMLIEQVNMVAITIELFVYFSALSAPGFSSRILQVSFMVVQFFDQYLAVPSRTSKIPAIMFDYEDFHDVFGSGDAEYDTKTIKKIRENRSTLEGELFIDKLLKALGFSKGKHHWLCP